MEFTTQVVGLATGTPQLRLTYAREALLSLRSAAPLLLHDGAIPSLPPVGQKTDTACRTKKRGKRGGARTRLKRRPFRQPLPSIMFGNVQSIQNKADELRACVQYLTDYRQSCLICLSESWLTDTDPDSSVDLEGFTLARADRNANSCNSKGGGVCAYINKYCNPAHVTAKHKICTEDIELLVVNLRPYNLPHEIN